MGSDDQADFHDVTVLQETPKALRIVIEGEEKWVPKSVIHDDSDVFDGDENGTGTLIVKSWWAKKEGLL